MGQFSVAVDTIISVQINTAEHNANEETMALKIAPAVNAYFFL